MFDFNILEISPPPPPRDFTETIVTMMESITAPYIMCVIYLNFNNYPALKEL